MRGVVAACIVVGCIAATGCGGEETTPTTGGASWECIMAVGDVGLMRRLTAGEARARIDRLEAAESSDRVRDYYDRSGDALEPLAPSDAVGEHLDGVLCS